MHYTQDFVGPAVYTGLCKPRIIRRALLALLCTQGFAVTTLYAGAYRPCSIQALHYTQACACPAQYAGLHSMQGCTVRMQGCTGPAVYAGLCRPCTVRRTLPALHYTQGFTGHSLYAELCRPCTICRTLQVLHHT